MSPRVCLSFLLSVALILCVLDLFSILLISLCLLTFQ